MICNFVGRSQTRTNREYISHIAENWLRARILGLFTHGVKTILDRCDAKPGLWATLTWRRCYVLFARAIDWLLTPQDGTERPNPRTGKFAELGQDSSE